MTVSDDMLLLQAYAGGKSEEAFTTLVSRHINLVYSVALRGVGNPHEAEEITQSVFLTLAKKARQLGPATVLSGWLYQTARLTAANARRTEVRRLHREQEAHMQSTLNEPEPDLWRQVGPLLDEAMAELSESDRNAVVLRFFENKALKEVGAALGTSDDAAKMRVNRAVEKLRGFFERRGVPISSAGLAAVIGENSVQAAPAGLAAAIAQSIGPSAVLAGSTITLAKGAVQLMTWTKISMAVGAAAAIALAAAGWNKVSTARQQVAELQAQLQKQTQLNQNQQAEIVKLQEKNTALDRRIESNAREVARARNQSGMAQDVIAKAKAAAKGDKYAEMFKDPAMQQVMRSALEKTVRQQYGSLVKQLNLTPDTADKFYQTLLDNKMAAMTNSTDYLAQGDMTGLKEASVAAEKQLNASLQDLLGSEGFAQYQQYQSGLGDRMLLDQMKGNFADNPLTDDQQQRLLQLMQTTRQAVSGGGSASLRLGGQEFSVATSPDAMNRQLEQEQTIQQQVLQQAADFLSPAQLQTLGAAQSNQINLEKMGFAMAQKMFGTQLGATTPGK